MADQSRSLTYLTSALADNTTGNITPQNLRDFMQSLMPTYGGFYAAGSADTTIASSGTFYKATMTTAASPALRGMSYSTNRLTHTFNEQRMYKIDLSACIKTAAAASKTIRVALARNGVIFTSTTIQTDTRPVANQRSFISLTGWVNMSLNDYVEVWVTNATDTTAVNFDYVNLSALGLIY